MTNEAPADLAALGRALEIVTWLRRSRKATDVSATALSLLDRLDSRGAHGSPTSPPVRGSRSRR